MSVHVQHVNIGNVIDRIIFRSDCWRHWCGLTTTDVCLWRLGTRFILSDSQRRLEIHVAMLACILSTRICRLFVFLFDVLLCSVCHNIVHFVLRRQVPSLQMLCHGVIKKHLSSAGDLRFLCLPPKIRGSIAALFVPTIKVRYTQTQMYQ